MKKLSKVKFADLVVTPTIKFTQNTTAPFFRFASQSYAVSVGSVRSDFRGFSQDQNNIISIGAPEWIASHQEFVSNEVSRFVSVLVQQWVITNRPNFRQMLDTILNPVNGGC